jgi:hypothetical protein
MRVLSVCEYLIDEDRDPDHSIGRCIVKAVKGMPFDGYVDITVGGRQQRLDSDNPELAVAWAAERLCMHVFRMYRQEALGIVSVPGHDHSHQRQNEGGHVHRLGLSLAEALRGLRMTAEVLSLLHWSQPVESARKGGPRDAAVLGQLLRVASVPRHQKLIILDDVVTTGGHVEAAYAALVAAGCEVADIAFVVARTVRVKGDAIGGLLERCPRNLVL